MEKYLYYHGKKLRYGFTTGSAATASAVASAELLINGNYTKFVEILLPSSEYLKIEIDEIKIDGESVISSVIKDGGDDPDITNGIKIISSVKKIEKNEINVIAGEGIGIVRKKGLAVEIGNAAINPVPIKIIKENLYKYIENKNYGLEVKIIVPKGEEIAKRTLNSKLGIIGGISILGTTGIVKPMSEDAFKDSLALEFRIALEYTGTKDIYFVFGNYGKNYLINKFGKNENEILVISNFLGYLIEKACEYNVKKIRLLGNIGKFIKVAGGIFQTHSLFADARLEILVANALISGEKQENLIKIINSNTTEEAVNYIENQKTYNLIAKKAKLKCEELAKRYGKDIEFETLFFSNEKGELGRTDNF